MVGIGTTVAQGGLALGGDVTLNRTMNLAGTSEIQGDFTISGTGTLTSAGVLTKTAGSGTATIQPTFHNAGALNVNSGTLALLGNGTHQVDGDVTVANVVVSGATVNVGGLYDLSASSTTVSSGSLIFASGSQPVNLGDATI